MYMSDVLVLAGFVALFYVMLFPWAVRYMQWGRVYIWTYRFIPHFMVSPDLTDSEYLGKFPPRFYSNEGMVPIITKDKVMERWGREYYMKYLFGKSDYYKAAFTAHFIAQTNKYRTDIDNYGRGDLSCLPVQNFYKRANDCEDYAIDFSFFCHCVGLETILVHISGHMFSGVAIKNPPWHMRFMHKVVHEGETYYLVDCTNIWPWMGFNWNFSKPILDCEKVIIPSQQFMDSLRRLDE